MTPRLKDPPSFGPGFDRAFRRAVVLGALTILAAASAVAVYYSPPVSDVGYAPRQPIAFSHRLHAGTMKIPCLYCHTGAEVSAHATVPATSTCLNCHRAVKTDSPEIQKLARSERENRPIEWVRVHRLPDFAYFNHSRHIQARVACQSCHGPVEEMERVTQVKTLTMGWCLDCHRDPSAHVIPAAETAPHAAALLAALPPAERTSASREIHSAPENCNTCHR